MEDLIVIVIIFISTFFLADNINISFMSTDLIFIILLSIEYVFYVLWIKEPRKINDRIYEYASWRMGSQANFFNQTEGNRWTKSSWIKSIMSKGDLKINIFKFTNLIKTKFYIFSLVKQFENFECHISSKDLIKSGIVFGQMGGGKTEFYNYIIEQNTFNRYLVYDSKGDFTQYFYTSKRDIILNPYDSRSHIWNPFEEAKNSPFIMEIFMENLLNAVAGDKKDFFSASSKERFMTIFNDIFYKQISLSSKQKFNLFIEQLKLFFEIVESGKKDSEKDVVSTMKLTFEFLDYMNFCIQNGAKTFTIKKFLETNNCKLFLLSRDDQKTKLTPFLTGFIAAFNAVLLSKKDDKENLTLLALDEYLTFAKNLDDETLESMHTRIRSRGGCLLPGVQFFPQGRDEDLTQKLLNSATYWFLFQGIDDYTLERINKTVGKVRYKKQNSSLKNEGMFGNIQSTSYTTEETNLLNTTMFQSLGEKFEHICFIPSKKILYQAYTPRANIQKRNESFILSDNIAKYYRSK